MSEKQIVLIPNQAPKIIGNWSLYELIGMSNALQQLIQKLLQDTAINKQDDDK